MKRKITQLTIAYMLFFPYLISAIEPLDNKISDTIDYGSYLTLGIKQIKLSPPEKNLKVDFVSESYAGFGYQFSNHWSTEIDFLTSKIADQTTNIGDIKYLGLSGVYRYSLRERNSWQARFGLGLYQFDTNSTFQSNEWSVNIGTGYNFHLNSNLFLSLDLQTSYPFNRKKLDWQSSIALSYFFTKTKGIAPKPQKRIQTTHNPQKLIKDSDRDGIKNQLDQCPNTPMHLMVDNQGCSRYIIDRQSITLQVAFDNNSTHVKKEYYDHIESLARFMKLHPSLNVTIEGHTDNKGLKNYNQKLSKLRAANVVHILNSNFQINANRIKSIGFGELHPIADNATSSGRAINRRVQATLEVELKKPQFKKLPE